MLSSKGAEAEWKQVCRVRSRAQGGPAGGGRRDPRRPVGVGYKRVSARVSSQLDQVKVSYGVVHVQIGFVFSGKCHI